MYQKWQRTKKGYKRCKKETYGGRDSCSGAEVQK